MFLLRTGPFDEIGDHNEQLYTSYDDAHRAFREEVKYEKMAKLRTGTTMGISLKWNRMMIALWRSSRKITVATIMRLMLRALII